VSGANPLVLIVDDDGRNRKLAADLLRLAGCKIMEAASGGEALSVAAGRLPDVILMDLRLPDLDGAQATRMLRADPRTAHVPVIALTVASLQGEEEWLAQTGFAGYIRKPIDVDQFAVLVRGFMRPAAE
jgi:two-component system, cell cycle response regulator DivK